MSTANRLMAAASGNSASGFGGLTTRFEMTGSSLSASTDDFSSSLLQSSGAFGGSGSSQYYQIDSRSTASNKLAWYFDLTSVPNYDHFMIQFEYYWDAGDNFKTTFAWQNNTGYPSGVHTHFRTQRPVAGGQSGRWMGVQSPTKSSTWSQPSSTWIPVVGYHNVNNNTGYMKVNNNTVISGATGSSYSYYSSADTISFGQFVGRHAGDNGIRMRVGVVQISCWNGLESDAPAFNGRFT